MCYKTINHKDKLIKFGLYFFALTKNNNNFINQNLI